jgi:hypothetical protein
MLSHKTGTNSALAASTGGKKPKKGGKKEHTAASGEEKKCFNCGKIGHWKDNCWRPGGGKEGQGPKQQAQKGKKKGKGETTNSATATQGDVEVAFVCTLDFTEVANALNVPEDQCGALIDCRASQHFSPARKHFVTFHVIPPKLICTADGRSVQAIGEGDMVIELPNGPEHTTIRLKNVLYAPKMAFTL